MIYLDGTKIEEPASISIEKFKIAETSRLASGKMVVDTKAIKREFTLSYNDVIGSELKKIINELMEKDFILFEFPSKDGKDVLDHATVYCEDIPYELDYADENSYYTNISFTLIEQ